MPLTVKTKATLIPDPDNSESETQDDEEIPIAVPEMSEHDMKRQSQVIVLSWLFFMYTI